MSERFNVDTSDVLGANYLVTSITSSNYNPSIDGTVTVTVTVKDVYGDAVSGEEVTVSASGGAFTALNGSSITGASSVTGTTNASGQFTLTYTCSVFGLITFTANNTQVQVNVDGWKEYAHSTWSTGYYYVYYNKDTVRLTFQETSAVSNSTSWADFAATIFSDNWIRPNLPVVAIDNTGNMQIRVANNSAKIAHRSNTGSNTSGELYIQMMWTHRGLP